MIEETAGRDRDDARLRFATALAYEATLPSNPDEYEQQAADEITLLMEAMG